MVNQRIDNGIVGPLVAILIVSTVLLMAVSAFAANYLNWKQLPTEETLKGSVGNEKFNTVRFETFGGTPERRIVGYFLYKDGIRVSTNGPQLEPIGKLTLNEVFADYDRVVKEKFYRWASNPIIKEMIRENTVIGYAVSDLNMEITLWDVTSVNEPSKISLELRYKDLRSVKGQKGEGGPR